MFDLCLDLIMFNQNVRLSDFSQVTCAKLFQSYSPLKENGTFLGCIQWLPSTFGYKKKNQNTFFGVK